MDIMQNVGTPANETTMPIFSFSGLYSGKKPVRYHSHPAAEIIFFLGGECSVNFSAKERILCRQGDLLVIDRNVSHNQVSLEKSKTIFTTFNTNIQDILGGNQWKLIHFGADRSVPQYLELIHELAQSLCYQQCGEVIYSLLNYIRLSEKRMKESSSSAVIREVIELISRDFAKPLTIQSLAESIHISPSYLRAIFRQEMHTSIFQYLQDFRMANARRLLRQPYGNIKEIAYACGYPDNGYFARQFKKLHHCTPQEYRSRKFADPEFKAEHKLDFIRQ